MAFEDDLKRRMDLARLQGWSEDEVTRSAMIERGLERQRQAAQPQQPQKPQGAGRAGGLKGFALDLVPFGRVAEKAINHNAGKITAGEVGTEALLSAVPFGLGRFAKGARAAKGAVSAARGAEAAKGTTAAAKTLPSDVKGMFVAPARNSAATDAGIRKATIARGSTLNTNTDQQRLVNLVGQLPSMRGSATAKFRNVDKTIAGMADQVDQLFSGVKTTVPARRFQSSINAVSKDIVDANERKRFAIDFRRNVESAFGKQLPAQLTATDVNTLRRSVNSEMSSIYRKIDAGTSLTDRDHAFLRLKKTLDDQLTAMAPKGTKEQVTAINRNMNTLIQGRAEFKKASETGGNLPVLGNLFGVGPTAARVIQAGADYGARGVRQARRVTDAPVGRTLKQQAGVRLGADFLGLRPDGAPGQPQSAQLPPSLADAFPQNPDASTIDALVSGGANDFNTVARLLAAPAGPPETPASSPAGGMQYTSAQLAGAAQQALLSGDVNSYKLLADAADQASSLEQAAAKTQAAQAKASGAGGPNITKVTAQQYGLAQTGFSSLQNLRQLLQSNPGILTRTATPGRQLPVVGGYITNAAGTGEYDAIGYNIADTLLRLRTGATANESEIRNLQSQIMPRAGDNQQTVQRKLQQLDEAFNGVLQTANGGAGSGFEEELMQLLGNQQYAY